MSIDFNELRELLNTIAQTDISELTLKSDEFELTVRKGVPVAQNTVAYTTPEIINIASTPLSQAITPPPPTDTPQPTDALSPVENNWVEITSPMVGTFYTAPAPGEEPFAEIGDRLSVGQTVCIIEAMKLMNEIEAEVAGEVMEILVENGEPVEYGQALMKVKPN